ncbi:MAG: hypothetical protein UX54_C0031G0007 [Parcubacteria group bacterium GW2011_GWA2_46_39]|nr:MAG: hypothetical protein UX54_C0031G0007 [Parcubacteria group bacterium GW2011_GWA2_46_39]
MPSVNCIWCEAEIAPETLICPKCDRGQLVSLALDRYGQCQCEAPKKMLIATITNGNNGRENVCGDCIKPHIASKVAGILMEKRVHFSNQDIEEKVGGLSGGRFGRRYTRYTYEEKLAALISVVAMIHTRREKIDPSAAAE